MTHVPHLPRTGHDHASPDGVRRHPRGQDHRVATKTAVKTAFLMLLLGGAICGGYSTKEERAKEERAKEERAKEERAKEERANTPDVMLVSGDLDISAFRFSIYPAPVLGVALNRTERESHSSKILQEYNDSVFDDSFPVVLRTYLEPVKRAYIVIQDIKTKYQESASVKATGQGWGQMQLYFDNATSQAVSIEFEDTKTSRKTLNLRRNSYSIVNLRAEKTYNVSVVGTSPPFTETATIYLDDNAAKFYVWNIQSKNQYRIRSHEYSPLR